MSNRLSLKDIKELVKLDEGYNLEFKEKAISTVKASICAFANSDGGQVLLGVKDNKKIIGLKDIKENMLKVSNYLSNFNPVPIVDYYKVEDLIVINVPKQINENIFTTGNLAYIREGETNKQLTIDQLTALLQERRKVNFDTKLNIDFSFEKDFNKIAFNNFLKLAKIKNVNEDEYLSVLENLGFIKDTVFTNCGILLFCQNVESFFQNGKINIIEYDENEEVFEIKKINYDFYKNLSIVEEILRTKLNVKFNVKGFLRSEEWEIPKEVLRELVLNAMGHRDYNSNGVVQIDIFKDRLEIYNPGGLIEGLKKEDLGKFGSRPRNLFLFSMLDKINLVENIGSGIKRVKRILTEKKLQYEYDVTSNYFKFTIFRGVKKQNVGANVGINVGTNVGAKLKANDRQQLILKKISDNSGYFSIRTFAEEIGVNPKTIERDLKDLDDMVYYDKDEDLWRVR